MGGFGSGGYSRSKQATVEDVRSTTIGFLAKMGFLRPCVVGSISWTQGGDAFGSVSVVGGFNQITFAYTTETDYEEPEKVEQHIHIERTRCHFGGSRPWFICPRCQGRRGLLLLVGGRFACRRCYRLPYTSQTESRSDRATRRIRKVQKRLGNPDWENVLDPWFPKPKGMHWKTYDRIVARADKPLRTIEFEMARFNLLDWVKMI